MRLAAAWYRKTDKGPWLQLILSRPASLLGEDDTFLVVEDTEVLRPQLLVRVVWDRKNEPPPRDDIPPRHVGGGGDDDDEPRRRRDRRGTVHGAAVVDDSLDSADVADNDGEEQSLEEEDLEKRRTKRYPQPLCLLDQLKLFLEGFQKHSPKLSHLLQTLPLHCCFSPSKPIQFSCRQLLNTVREE